MDELKDIRCESNCDRDEMPMEGITEAEINVLIDTVTKLNAAGNGVSYRLIEIKGTFYIYPQFPSKS